MNVYPSVFNPKKKARGCESLASVDSCSEHEPPTGECKKLDETSPRTSLCRHSFVQDYVNSLIMEAAENGGVNPGEVQYLHHHQHQHRHYPYPNEKETDVGDEYSRNKCDSRARFIHFPNIFLEMISLDNVKPFGKKKRGLRDKPANAFNSFSMENLIF
ncbi:hypothetical protein RUM44_010986 [Polyplax serrata]|uniref:Uncharacterized protein n=1 Tax=Polyplax serrata TaxID=468196 RepID=A0ABR1ANQ9_POLSC